MPTLPAEFTKVILIFESVFSKRVWRHAQVLIAGALLAVGQRTVGAVLRVMGLGQLRQFQRFHRRLGSLPLPVRTAAWYIKLRPTFPDTLAWVRRWLWSHPYFSTSGSNPDMVEIPRGVLDRLTDTLCYAA
jgi:hypothetical protein